MSDDVSRSQPIDGLVPRGDGHQFVFYGDACSGVAGGRNEATFAETNRVVQRLTPTPEFVVFAGDEIVGLTTSEKELRRQWRHWLEVEMAWLDRSAVPLYNTTSNHTTYDEMSERVFADVLGHLPRNGPADQLGLSYAIRRHDLLIVAVHTCWSGLGGEGHVETAWLDAVLDEHADARFKFVVGHHPAFPVNGFAGANQRELGAENAAELWDVLVGNGVIAYLCSHILAFDVQVHRGVLQIVSAGAATPYRMPADVEYLHAVQVAVDGDGLRYQVVDQRGAVRERLSWPPAVPAVDSWPVRAGAGEPLVIGSRPTDRQDPIVGFRLTGTTGRPLAGPGGHPETLVATEPVGAALPAAWIGLTGVDRRLTVTLGPEPGRSPHYWFGPELGQGRPFDVYLALHTGMGPGGVLWRPDDDGPWSSLASASPWGPERLPWSERWSVGQLPGEPPRSPFTGSDLTVAGIVC